MIDNEQLKKLAIAGAKARLAELNEERDQLMEAIHELSGRKMATAQDAMVLYAAPTTGTPPSQPIARGKYRIQSPEFMAAAIQRVKNGEYAVDVARSVGVRDSVLHGWLSKARVKGGKVPPEEAARRRAESKRRNNQAKANAQEPAKAPPGATKHITDAMREKAISLHARGLSHSEIADRVGVTATSIRRWVTEGTGKKKPAPERQRYDDDFKRRAIALAKETSAVDTARKLGIVPSTLHNWIAGRGGPKPAPKSKPTKAAKPEEPEPEPAPPPALAAPLPSVDPRRIEALKLYQSGLSTVQVAKRTGIQQTTIAQWTRDVGLARPSANAGKARRRFDQAFKADAVARARAVGVSAAAIELDLTFGTLNQWVSGRGFEHEEKEPERKPSAPMVLRRNASGDTTPAQMNIL